MKKIIFAGFCLLTSVIGVIPMLFLAVQLHEQYGYINGQSSLSLYLNLLNLMPVFTVLCFLGIIGFIIGLWGLFEKNTK